MKSFEQILDENGFLCYTNVGVSMRPLIREGKDVMTIKKANGVYKKYDTVLFIRPNVEGRGKYVLHRIIKQNKDNTYFIVGDNCVSGENVKEENIIGVLTALKRGNKDISVDDFWYKVYVYSYCAPYKLRFLFLKTSRFIKKILRAVYKRIFVKK